MRSRGRIAVAAALACAVAAAGCGIGAGERSSGEATLTVTHDYGTEGVIDTVLEDPAETETVMRALDREAEISTRYGGGFVQSIEGTAGGVEGGRPRDWFFYVNGIESPVGAAEARVEPGDRIWWDHHDWTDVMRVPAVVGSFPQPFAAAVEESGEPIAIGCAAASAVCETVASALEQADVPAEVAGADGASAGEAPRILVGELEQLGSDPAAALLAAGPERSGVFARPAPGGGSIALLDERGEPALEGAFGLVAATAKGEEAPTWLVTATDAALLAPAAELLGAGLLHNRFALAVSEDGETMALPMR